MEIFRLPSLALNSRLPLHRTICASFSTSICRKTPNRETNEDLNQTTSTSPPNTTLNSYVYSKEPNPAQLKYAANFFTAGTPQILFSAPNFRQFPPSSFPEIAILGRSNVGKSSLLNALFGRNNARVAHVSKQPGRTRTMNGFGVTGGLQYGQGSDKEARWKQFPRGGLVVVDMPGYGGGSRQEWGVETLKYLQQRKQLRRTFVLVDAEHGLQRSDLALLLHLRAQGVSHQIVLSKIDKLLFSGKRAHRGERLERDAARIAELCADIRDRTNHEAGDGRAAVGDILCCSSQKSLEPGAQHKLGMNALRWAMLVACGMESTTDGRKKISQLIESPNPDGSRQSSPLLGETAAASISIQVP